MQAHNAVYWFHNLKFDGKFIIPELFKLGFSHVNGEVGPGRRGTFKTLISDMGAFYSITVRWWNGHTTEFRDSYKKVPMTVRRAAESWKLTITKGDLDYHTPRPIGHQLTPAERDYLHRDVSIMAHIMADIIASGASRLTIGSDALAEYKRLVNKNMFGVVFPVLSTEMDAEIRQAYRGGWTYKSDRWKPGIQCSGIVLDVNSLYPYVMYDRPMPYGYPEYVEGKVEPTEDRPLVIMSVTMTAKLKADHVPCIQIKKSGIFSESEYIKEIIEPETLMMTNIDFDLYCEHYDVDVLAFGGGWRFKAAVGLFKTYIDKWSKIKAESKGGRREIAKLHLNSLYGKFATNPHIRGMFPVMDDQGVMRLKHAPDETRDPVYTAVGVFITSYARDITIRAAQANFDTFIYADTDSLHLLRDDVPEGIDVHPTKLGAWKFEYAFTGAYYIRAKAYLERMHDLGGCIDCANCEKCADGLCTAHSDGHYTNHIAGLPEKISEDIVFDDLRNGSNIVFNGKLKPKSVRGGVILVDTPYTLKLELERKAA